MEFLQCLRELNIYSMMLRVLLAMFIGGMVGLDRERKGRPAGFRTYMLVALGSSLTVMLGQYLSIMMNGPWLPMSQEVGVKTDVVRFSAQVINGIGFLGAGTILVTGRQEVKGLTTAAALWASACIGIAVGAGFYECVIVGFVLILVSMKLLPKIEDYIVSKALNLTFYVELDTIENLGAIITKLKKEKIKIYDVDISKEQHATISQINAVISVHLPEHRPHTEVLADISTVDGIISIEMV